MKADPQGLYFYRSAHFMASVSLTRALLPVIQAQEQKGAFDELWETGIELIAEAPVPEAIPTLKGAAMRRSDFGVEIPIRGLGRLASAPVAQALEDLWLAKEGHHEYLCALSEALGSCGDAGFASLERLAKVRSHPSYLTYGLCRLATQQAAIVAKTYFDPRDDNEAVDILRVAFAAGEPGRSQAFQVGMESARPFVRDQALELAGQYEPSAETKEKIRRLALSDGPLSEKALSTYYELSYKYVEKPSVTWAGAADGLQIGVQCRSEAFRGGQCLRFRVWQRNSGKTPLLVIAGQKLWQVQCNRPEVLAQKPADPWAVVVDMAPGEVSETEVVWPLNKAAYSGDPLRLSLVYSVKMEDYHDLVGWIGNINVGGLQPELPVRLEEKFQAEKWNMILQDIVSTGKLPLGFSLGWSTSHGWHGESFEFVMTDDACRMNGSLPWIALPADLMILKTDEIRDVAAVLLEGNLLAAPVLSSKGNMGKYPPYANLRIETREGRAECSGNSFNAEVKKKLEALAQRIFLPRLEEARKRIAADP